MLCLRNKIVASILNKYPVITFEVTYKIKNKRYNILSRDFLLFTFSKKEKLFFFLKE